MNNKRKNVILCVSMFVSTLLSLFFALEATRTGGMYAYGYTPRQSYLWIYDLFFSLSIGGFLGSVANQASYYFRKINVAFDIDIYFVAAVSGYITYKYIELFYGIQESFGNLFDEKAFVYVIISVAATVIAAYMFRRIPVNPDDCEQYDSNTQGGKRNIDMKIIFEKINEPKVIINNRHMARSLCYCMIKEEEREYTFNFNPDKLCEIGNGFSFYNIVEDSGETLGYIICKIEKDKLLVKELMMYSYIDSANVYKKILAEFSKENNTTAVRIDTNSILGSWQKKHLCEIISEFTEEYTKSEKGIEFTI